MIFDRANYINQPLPIKKELKTLFNQKDSLIIFEIGACEGEDSIKYSRLFPNSKIYAFEPLPKNIKLIENNLRDYSISNVYYYNKALSSKEGYAEFFVSKGRPKDAEESDWDYGNKSSSLLPPAEHINLVDFIEFKEKIIVETTTLKSFCNTNNISVIDFVHMDVQGAEIMVLEGAGDLIHSLKSIWLEVSKVQLYKNQPLVDEVNKFMTKHNFLLVKEDIEHYSGDHLYISKTFYPNFHNLFFNKPEESKSIFDQFFKKLGLSH